MKIETEYNNGAHSECYLVGNEMKCPSLSPSLPPSCCLCATLSANVNQLQDEHILYFKQIKNIASEMSMNKGPSGGRSPADDRFQACVMIIMMDLMP